MNATITLRKYNILNIFGNNFAKKDFKGLGNLYRQSFIKIYNFSEILIERSILMKMRIETISNSILVHINIRYQLIQVIFK